MYYYWWLEWHLVFIIFKESLWQMFILKQQIFNASLVHTCRACAAKCYCLRVCSPCWAKVGQQHPSKTEGAVLSVCGKIQVQKVYSNTLLGGLCATLTRQRHWCCVRVWITNQCQKLINTPWFYSQHAFHNERFNRHTWKGSNRKTNGAWYW